MISHSLAQYPTGFVGCIVSPTKICMQYGPLEAKLRYKEGAEYIKLPSTAKALPISVTGTHLAVSAIGCQMPVLEDAQRALYQAFLVYGQSHAEVYRKTYGKEFMDTLIELRTCLDETINSLKAGET